MSGCGSVSRMNKRRNTVEYIKSYALIAPFMIIFLFFSIIPVLASIFFGFTDFNILETPNIIGLDNYVRMFTTDDVFFTALRNTIVMAIVIGPGGYLISMLMAWLINEISDRLRPGITFLFYIPSISGNVYLMWTVLFSGDRYGYINGFLLDIGAISTPIVWLKDTRYMLPIVILVSLWASLGTSFLTFVAGFKGVDKQYYEAGLIDGVRNRWQELWYITLPILKPQMMFGAVMSISSAFGVGVISSALCGIPSTDYAVHTLMNHLVDFGGIRYEMGYASALATVLFLMMAGMNLIIQRMIMKVGK